MDYSNNMVQYGFIIALYMATQFIPIDKKGEVVFFDAEMNKNITLMLNFNKSTKKWVVTEKEKPNEAGISMIIDDKKHSLKPESEGEEIVFMTKFLELKEGEKINFKKIKKFKLKPEYASDNDDLMVEMKKNELNLSQKKGFLQPLKTIKITYSK